MNYPHWGLVAFVLLVSLAPAVGASQPEGVTSWTIAQVEEIEVDGEAVATSPDGTMLAVIGSDGGLCVLELDAPASRCAGEGMPNREVAIAWAPDSSAVAFSTLPDESDIYVYEVATAELTNLTDDGVEASLGDIPNGTPLDDVPAWSPDSRQVAFVRSVLDDGGGSTTLMRVDRAGGEPVEIARLPMPEPYAVYSPMAWMADGHLAYVQSATADSGAGNGIWRVPVGGGTPELVVPGSEADDVPGPAMQSVDAERGMAIVYSEFLIGRPQVEDSRPVFWLVDLATGEKTPLGPQGTDGGPVRMPPFVVSADFSPDGKQVIAWVLSESRAYVLTLIDPASGATVGLEMPDQGEDIPPRQPQWVEGDRVVLLAPAGVGVWVVALEPAA